MIMYRTFWKLIVYHLTDQAKMICIIVHLHQHTLFTISAYELLSATILFVKSRKVQTTESI